MLDDTHTIHISFVATLEPVTLPAITYFAREYSEKEWHRSSEDRHLADPWTVIICRRFFRMDYESAMFLFCILPYLINSFI